MPRKSPPKPDEKPQFERFIEAATQIGAAKTDKDLSATIRKLAPHSGDSPKKRGKNTKDTAT
jgi:hypothetical protein